MNKIYRVEIKAEGVIEILADSDEAAHNEAAGIVKEMLSENATHGLYWKEPDIKPRRVLERGESS